MNRAYVALLLAALSWGLALTTADAALAEISATDLLLLETAAGTIVVVAACWITGRRVGGAWRPAVVLGSLEPGIAYVFANVGLILTSAAVGSMLFALESVFVVALAAVLLRTRPRRSEMTALVLGVLGTILVASAQSGGRSSGMGVGIMVMSTLISAGYVLATKRFANGNEPVALVARQGIASLVVTAPFILGASLNGGSQLGSASIGCILLAGLTGVIGFSIPYTLWTTSLPHVRPGFAAVALNLVPLVGVISATLLGQGALSPGQWTGGGLILFGLVLLTRAEIAATKPAETEPTEATELPIPTIPITVISTVIPVVTPAAVPIPIPAFIPAPRGPLEAARWDTARPDATWSELARFEMARSEMAPRASNLAGIPGQRAESQFPQTGAPRARPPATSTPAAITAPMAGAPRARPPATSTPAAVTAPMAGAPVPNAHRPSQGAVVERRRLRPGRTSQPVATPRQRAAARQHTTARPDATAGIPTQQERDRARQSSVR
ncbi:MAG TPA: EamA family transporter [Kineosporiaceae bacterium]|nr:EamA family transporter [Kineosporiaceae bacterium]